MSSTRKKKRDGSADNYPTPEWGIERFLEEWKDIHNVGKRWLEAGVGDGSILEVCDRFRPGIDWTTVDIRDTTPALLDLGLTLEQINIGSFFDLPLFDPESGNRWDVVIMNPPFRLTMAFLLRAWALAPVVVLFQSINFSGSKNRNPIMIQNVPDLYLLPDRVSHTGDGQTDSVYSGWHVWGPHPKVTVGEYRILKHTPIEIRKRQRVRVVKARDELLVGLDALFEAM